MKSGVLTKEDANKQIQAIANDTSIKAKKSSETNKKKQNEANANKFQASSTNKNTQTITPNVQSSKGSCFGCAPGQNADGSKAQDPNQQRKLGSMGKKGQKHKGRESQKGGGKKRN